MALITNIVIDQTAGNAVLTVTKLGNTVEVITYNNSTLDIIFSTRADINISFVEFQDYVAQVNIFQTAILFNYNPNVFLTVPFGSTTCTESHDIALNKWNLVCIYGATPRVCNYSADGASKTVDLVNRASPKTIYFLEWIYWIAQLNHYRNSVKTF